MISIVIPTWNRTPDLARALESIEKEFRHPFEIVIALAGPDEDTLDFLNRYQVTRPHVRILSLSRMPQSEARNKALESVRGQWVVFFDDDILLPKGYFLEAQRFLTEHPEAHVFGGPDRILPNAPYFERCLGLALASPLATAQTAHRHATKRDRAFPATEKHLILCNLWIRVDVFKKDRMQFDGRLPRNEENVLLHQLQSKGRWMYHAPQMWLYHRRNGISKWMRPSFRSGRMRMFTFHLYPRMREWIYFVPMFFVVYLFLALVSPHLWIKGPLALYFALNVFFALRLGFRDWTLIPGIVLVQFLVVIAYGTGSLLTWLKLQFGSQTP